MRMFSGLRSRCATPRLWQKATPHTIWRKMWRTSSSRKRGCVLSTSSRSPPSMYLGRAGGRGRGRRLCTRKTHAVAGDGRRGGEAGMGRGWGGGGRRGESMALLLLLQRPLLRPLLLLLRRRRYCGD